MLLAVPNVSEGRDPDALGAIGEGFRAGGAHLLDVHRDPDHNRSVFTLAAAPGELAAAVLAGARVALDRFDVHAHAGAHPRVGVVDVAPVVHPTPALRGAATAEALVLADLLGHELGVPVFLYGALGGGRTRADLRRGGPLRLAARIAARDPLPDFGPHRLHPTGGATLVTARPPLVAFNVELAPPATEEDARRIAGLIRDGGEEGLPGVRALGLHLSEQGIVQVSTNIEDHTRSTPAEVVAAVARHAPIHAAELVGLAPRAALAGFPADVPLKGFDPARHLIENALDQIGF